MSASRAARPTIRFVDEYCQWYEGLFPEVRSFEAFKLLHLGMTSYEQIQKWWELVMSAFLMVSLFVDVFDVFNDACPLAHQQFAQHPWWDTY